MTKVAQRQVLADIAPVNTNNPTFEGFRFAQVSGGEITASVEKIYEGGKSRPTVLCAPAEIGDITLTAHYDDDIDVAGGINIAAKVRALRPLVGQAFYNINIKTYNCDLEEKGTDRVYTSALLVGLTEPDGDSSSGAPSTFALTFSIQDVSPPSSSAANASANS
jgi:hypothetical protein